MVLFNAFKICYFLYCFLFGILWLSYFSSASVIVSSEQAQMSATKWLAKGKCKGIWRPENLIGRCLGLVESHKWPDRWKIPELAYLQVNSSADCRALCCNLGEKCVSWQFEHKKKDCKVGDAIRLGLEGAGTPLWCEPLPPAKWNGHVIVKRNDDGTCTWSPDGLPTQCFGLGAERLNSTKGRLNTQECQRDCCKDPNCGTWQEMPGRGCYYASETDLSCDDNGGAVYEGGRKCIPDFCGGMEAKILGPNYKKGNKKYIVKSE